jgi:hypothetical protein
MAGGSAAPQALSAGFTLAWAIGAGAVLAGLAVTAVLLRGPSGRRRQEVLEPA